LEDWIPSAKGADAAIRYLQESRHVPLRQMAQSQVLAWRSNLTQAQGEHHLRLALSDPDAGVRRQAILVAGRLPLPGLVGILLDLVDGKAPPVISLPDIPAEEQDVEVGQIEVGGSAADWELAALALGFAQQAEVLEHLKGKPSTPVVQIARALLGETELLKKEHFRGTGSHDVQLLAVVAVVRCKGKHGLAEALSYQMVEYGWEEETVTGMLRTMLIEEQAPGLAELQKAGSLEDLRGWYKRFGAEYVSRYK
jgi:hypothetical protein